MKKKPLILIILSVLAIAPLLSLVLNDIDIPILHPVEDAESQVSAEATLEMAYSKAIGSDNDAYHFQPNGAGYTTRNPDHNLTVNVTADTLTIAINDDTWQLTSHQAANSFSVDDNRLTIHRAGYDEWYVNGPVGLQQGFTLYEPSDVSFDIGGTLSTTASAQSLSIGDDLNFVGLMAYDDDGENVPVEFGFENDKLVYAYDDFGATYPLTIDPWVQQQKLTASDASIVDRFGWSVAIDGNTALIGAELDNCAAGNSCGSAYVFTRSGGIWTEQQKLIGNDTTSTDLFGFSVALDGDTALIGAPNVDCTAGLICGAAYVFTRSGGTWTEQEKLTASDASASAIFGRSVALNSDTALIGTWESCVNGILCGSAYVFTRSGGIWTEQQKLIPNDLDNRDHFAVSLALDGDTALIGSYLDACTAGTWCGSAYVFTRDNDIWSQQQKITPTDIDDDDHFGISSALDGDTAMIGAFQDACTKGEDCGSVYVFTRENNTWTQQQKLTADDAAAEDLFGRSVALSVDTVLIGSEWDDCTEGNNCGSVYVFTRNGTAWTQEQKFTANDAEAGNIFGFTVALSGATAIIGSHLDDQPAGTDSGSAYIFIIDGFVAPTDTPVPPTDTPIPPTDTPIPPTDTPGPTTIVASAACVDENLAVTISAGDGSFNITASAGINTPVNGVGIGTTTINGPEKWDNLTVTETGGDLESINLGTFRCRTDERPVPVSPAHQSRTTNPFPTFSWTGISIANNYRVWVFDDAVVANRTVDIRENSGGPTMMTLTVPLPDGRLFWRVRGRQNRVWSLWSIRYTLFKDPVVPFAVPTPVPTIDLNSASTAEPPPTVVPPTFPAPPNSR